MLKTDTFIQLHLTVSDRKKVLLFCIFPMEEISTNFSQIENAIFMTILIIYSSTNSMVAYIYQHVEPSQK